MNTPDVMVVGAGPAGLSAATELARRGLTCRLVEQRDQIGGAIYRQRAAGSRGSVNRPSLLMPDHQRRRRDTLMHDFAQVGALVTPMMQSVLIGVDRDGRFLIDNRSRGRVESVQTKAVILALGAVEQVLPFEGWELPGVVTAGGMQVQFKETGDVPQGPVMLAGSGPLLLALAAQLAAAGHPPIAVLERAQPVANAWRQGGSVVDALRSWPYVQEAALYASELLRARIPYRTGWRVLSARQQEAGLAVVSQHSSGLQRTDHVKHLVVHDGLSPNNTGLPLPKQSETGCIVHAGDCREALGAAGAVADGQRAAQQVARYLGRACADQGPDHSVQAARRTQHALGKLFRSAPPSPTANTVVCRCEGVRRADFDRLQGAGSARELRLVGRFGMGLCQGRYCARSVSALAHERGIEFAAEALNGESQRWPLRPVSLAALAAYTEEVS